MTLRIKGWEKFQHFKDRKPPWVKLYRDVLDDLQWHELDPAAAKVLVMLWLIASEHSGNLPDFKTLAFRLRMTEKQTKSTISKLTHWLDQDDIKEISDIKMISKEYQNDPLEKETEKETEKERDADIKNDISESVPDGLDLKAWERWKRYRGEIRKPIKPASILAAQASLAGFGSDQSSVVEHSIAQGWQGLFAPKGGNGIKHGRESEWERKQREARESADRWEMGEANA